MLKKKAFTLIEMLLVLAIIGTLSGFLLAAASRARAGTRRIACANNLRQIGVAVHMFAEDNNSRLIPSERFIDIQYLTGFPDLEDYLGDGIDIFECPSYKYHDYSVQTRNSYGFNYEGLTETFMLTDGPLTAPGMRGIPVETVTNSVQCIMITDSGRADESEMDSYWEIFKDKTLMPRHSQGVNILFVAGHVEWHRVSDIPTSGADSTTWWNY